ncbi:MAG TPA: DNRLRE domain-containing protein, partial [Methanotrichaceae archaeon]|nr:DNRLRE domain-containing protein [Methanotrichaceae archaeon]
ESFGSERVLWATSDKGTHIRVAYLTFSGMTTLPNQIDSASLDIYVRSMEQPGEVSIHLLDRPVMSYMTWEDREEYDEENLATLNIEGTGWQTFDAAALVKKAAMECSEGCPFTVVLVAEGDASIGFASVDSVENKARLEYRTLE